MYRQKQIISVLLFLALMMSAAGADIYIRNKPVPSGTTYLSTESLTKFFTPQELARCEFDPETGEIRVDGETLAERLGPDSEKNIPVVALAVALGFEKRVNNELGVVDYVAPETLEGKKARADAPKRKGAEYGAAAARMANVFKESPQLSNHPDLERVQRIGQELAEVSDMPGQEWNFVVVADSSPNAFCTGVGWVAVTDGLLALRLSDDELAGVLAHEVGHGCRRDIEEQQYNIGAAKRAINEAKALYAERERLQQKQELLYDRARRARELDLPDEAAQAEREASALTRPIKNLDREINLKVERADDHADFATASVFQHQDELDADQKGLRYATTAGYSADGLMSALKKLAGQNAKTFGQAAYQGGASHPPLAKRLETMAKVLASWR